MKVPLRFKRQEGPQENFAKWEARRASVRHVVMRAIISVVTMYFAVLLLLMQRLEQEPSRTNALVLRPTTLSLASGDDESCSADQVLYWFQQHFYIDQDVPFSTQCLRRLVDQSAKFKHTPDIDLLTVYIRKRYMERISHSKQSSHHQPRYVIYDCTENKYCEGHGNRIGAMAYVFAMAIMSDSRFLIFNDNPVRLDQYWRPVSELDWKEEFLMQHGVWDDYTSNSTANVKALLSSQGVETQFHHQLMFKGYCSSPWSTEFAYCITGKESVTERFFGEESSPRALFVNTDNLFSSVMFRYHPDHDRAAKDYRIQNLSHFQWASIMMKLFMGRSTPAFTRALSLQNGKVLDKDQTPFTVGLQFRLGQQGKQVSFTDDPPRNSLAGSARCMLPRVRSLCQDHTRCVVFVTSDSEEAVELVKNELRQDTNIEVQSGSGTIRHIGMLGASSYRRSNETMSFERQDMSIPPTDSMHEHLRTYGDWFRLATADALVLPISTYALTAAYYKGRSKPVEILVLEKSCVFYEQNLPEEETRSLLTKAAQWALRYLKVMALFEKSLCFTLDFFKWLTNYL